MQLNEYPVITYYLEQAESMLKNEFYLGLLLVSSTLTELVTREFAGDSGQENYARLLEKLLSKNRISNDQYEILDRIRIIRNRYIHLNVGNLIQRFAGLGIIDEKGVVTFLNETIDTMNCARTDVLNFFKLHLRVSSLQAFSLTKKALDAFSTE